MKKKLLALIMATALACSFTGCGDKGLENEYVTISQIEKLEVPEIEHTEITDEIIGYYIESKLGEKAERKEAKDRAVADGDIVNIDYKGFVDGVEFEGGAAENAELQIGSGTFIGATEDYKGFEEQIIGHSKGDKFDIEVQFPADYHVADLKDKVATFKISLNAIYEDEVPELNDEFVASVSKKSKTVEEYKKEVRKELEKNEEEQVKSQLAYDVLTSLGEKTEVKKFPEGVVEERIAKQDEYYRGLALNSGLEFGDFCQQYLGMTEEEYTTTIKEVSEDEVKLELACKLVAEEKNLEPSKKEYDKLIKKFAEESGMGTPSEFLEMVGEDTIKTAIIQDEVGKYLAKTCVQVKK